MQAITDFGDSAVLLPVALIVFGFLFATGARETARLWAATIIGTGLLLLVLKLVLHDCGVDEGRLRLTSPSGHAGMGMAFFAAFGVLIAGLLSPPWRYLVIGLAIGFGLMIAVSRIALEAHSLAEVVVGAAIGGIAAWLFARGVAALPAARLKRAPLWIAVCIGLILLLHGERLNAETTIKAIGARLLPNVGICLE